MAELPSQESTPAKSLDSVPEDVKHNIPSFFREDHPPNDDKTPPRTTVHPFEHHDDFESHPPIPLFNIIIRSKTGEVIENRTGRP